MINNREQANERIEHLFADITAWVIINEKIYFRAFSMPGVYCLDKKSGEMKIIEEMEKPENWKKCEYCGAIPVDNDMIVYPPYHGTRYISVFHVLDEKFSYIRLDNDVHYRSGVRCGEYIYFIPEKTKKTNDILAFNIYTQEVAECDFMVEPFFDGIKCWNNSVCYINNKLFLCGDKAGTIWSFDLKKMVAESFEIPRINSPISVISWIEDEFWLTSEDGEIIRWKIGKDVQILRLCKQPRKHIIKNQFSSIKKMGRYVYLAPVAYPDLIRVDIESDKIETLMAMDSKTVFWDLLELDDCHLYANTLETGEQDVCNYIICEDAEIKINMERFSIDNIYSKSWLFPNMVIHESFSCSLDIYLKSLVKFT